MAAALRGIFAPQKYTATGQPLTITISPTSGDAANSPRVGDTVVVIGFFENDSTTGFYATNWAVADSKGNVYTVQRVMDSKQTGRSRSIAIATAYITTALADTDVITVSQDHASTGMGVIAASFTGLPQQLVAYGGAQVAGVDAGPPNSTVTTSTPVVAGDLVICGYNGMSSGPGSAYAAPGVNGTSIGAVAGTYSYEGRVGGFFLLGGGSPVACAFTSATGVVDMEAIALGAPAGAGQSMMM